MREIKFRGKRLDNKEWVYGYLVKSEDYIFDYSERIDILFIIPIDNFILKDYREYRIIEETIGQFTELYDKNNVAIYEGDKMKNSKGGKGIVKYSKYGEFVLEFEDDNTMSSFNPAILRNYEVYGNIYEGGSER